MAAWTLMPSYHSTPSIELVKSPPASGTGAGDGEPKAERRDQIDVGGAEIGMDLGSEEIVDIRARPVDDFVFGIVTVDEIVGRMLVRPGGTQSVLVDDAKDRVGAHEVVWPHRAAHAMHALPGQIVRADRNWAVWPGQGRRHATIDGLCVFLDFFAHVR